VRPWSEMTGTAGRWCFRGLLAGIFGAGGLGLLPPLETILLTSAIVLFGVACVSRSAAPAAKTETGATEPFRLAFLALPGRRPRESSVHRDPRENA
jgi:hypothetical protein